MSDNLQAKMGIILASLICLPQFAIFIPYYDSFGRVSQTIFVILFFLLPCLGAYLYLRDMKPASKYFVYIFIGIAAAFAVFVLLNASGLSLLSAMMLCLFSPLICYLLLAVFPKTRCVELTKKLSIIFTIAAVILAFGGGWYARYMHMAGINAMALLGWGIYAMILAPIFVLIFIYAGVTSLSEKN
ncbi:hypothetical protein [Methanorbis furvi]|uniref:Transmembrane protein n=1 Tax=Methanorbis furvi TaxID=3028299 RepID=A0AAE4S9T6_9EURY|nr:hypothetical protein [Methanocorpusculaceae archaeon Ag1]